MIDPKLAPFEVGNGLAKEQKRSALYQLVKEEPLHEYSNFKALLTRHLPTYSSTRHGRTTGLLRQLSTASFGCFVTFLYLVR